MEQDNVNWDEFAAPVDTKKVLKELSDLTTMALKLKEEEAELEQKLKDKKAEVDKYFLHLIPDLLLDAGFEQIALETGERIAIQRIYRGSIKQELWEEAKAWLAERGDDVMIKTEVKSSFGKGRDEMEKSIRMMQMLKAAGIDYNAKESIHPQTLYSYIKQKMESGEELPQNLFGVHVVTQAKITK